MPPISFNEVPANIRRPWVYVEFDNTKAVQGLGVKPFKGLLVGQKTASGTIDALTPTRISSAQQAANYFGDGSHLHLQAQAWFNQTETVELWAAAFDDPGASVAATGDITFTGPATASGTLYLYIAGQVVQVGVTSGDSATAIALATVNAITAKTSLAVTAAVNGVDDFVVDITAKNKGTVGNQIDIRFNYYEGESLPAGVGQTITLMTGGTGTPDFSTLFAVLGDTDYNIWAIAYNDASVLATIEAELEDRSGPTRQIDTMVFTALDDTFANLGTFGNARNSEYVSIMGKYKAPNPSFEWGAAIAAIVSLHGQIDPARPFQTLKLSNLLSPAETDKFTNSERNLLLFDGIATHQVAPDGDVLIERLITTYQQNGVGADDISYLDVNTLLTLSQLRYQFRNRFLLKFPRHKLANDGTRFGSGQAIITPKVARAECIAIFREWEDSGLVENFDQFKADLVVERNEADPNRLDFLLPPDLVNQLRVTAAQIQFRL